jgi:hypothetical protein
MDRAVGIRNIFNPRFEALFDPNRLPAAARREICWRRIPRQVALSMAFEREAVDQSWLEKLHRQAGPPATFKPRTVS